MIEERAMTTLTSSGLEDALVYLHVSRGTASTRSHAFPVENVMPNVLIFVKPFDTGTWYGPVEQGPFLKALGIQARANALCANASEHQRDDIASALKRLTDPGAMGSLFKVMAMTSQGLPAPAGL